LKTTDGEKQEEQKENLYQKVKNLQKANEDISTLILLKNRVLEKNIQAVRDGLKNSANDQNKTIDDLRELIGNNFKNIYENTESLIFSIQENDKKYIEEFEKVKEVKDTLENTQGQVNDLTTKLDQMQEKMIELIEINKQLTKKK
jgi:uncharacterized coiled-coil protein SlyX